MLPASVLTQPTDDAPTIFFIQYLFLYTAYVFFRTNNHPSHPTVNFLLPTLIKLHIVLPITSYVFPLPQRVWQTIIIIKNFLKRINSLKNKTVFWVLYHVGYQLNNRLENQFIHWPTLNVSSWWFNIFEPFWRLPEYKWTKLAELGSQRLDGRKCFKPLLLRLLLK